MTTTSSTQKLVPLIEELSQSLTAIASALKENAQTAAPVEEAKQEAATAHPEETKQPAKAQPEKKTIAAPASAGSSGSRKKAITKEQIRAVLAEKSQAGLTEKVKALITSYGAKNLSDIAASHYEELFAAAQALE